MSNTLINVHNTHVRIHITGKGRAGVTFTKDQKLRPESTQGFHNPNNPGPGQYK